MKGPSLWSGGRVFPWCSWYEMGVFLTQGTHKPTQGGLASASWPAANRAIYLPMLLAEPFTVTEFVINNGTAAVAGSWDVGLYAADGAKIATSGTVAQTGVNTIQVISLAARLDRGVYYAGIMETSGSASVYRFAGGATSDWLLWGGLQEATGGTLPATTTFAANTTAFLPAFSIHSRAH